jgi:hypothetical protein
MALPRRSHGAAAAAAALAAAALALAPAPAAGQPLSAGAVLSMAGSTVATPDWCLALVELQLIDTSGRFIPVARVDAPAPLNASFPVSAVTDLTFGVVGATGLGHDPYRGGFAGYWAGPPCTPTSTLTLTFGAPAAVAQAMLWNRKDVAPGSVSALRNGFLLSLVGVGGGVVDTVSLAANDTVVVRNFTGTAGGLAAPAPPPPADAPEQLSNAGNWVRYIRLTTSNASQVKRGVEEGCGGMGWVGGCVRVCPGASRLPPTPFAPPLPHPPPPARRSSCTSARSWRWTPPATTSSAASRAVRRRASGRARRPRAATAPWTPTSSTTACWRRWT